MEGSFIVILISSFGSCFAVNVNVKDNRGFLGWLVGSFISESVCSSITHLELAVPLCPMLQDLNFTIFCSISYFHAGADRH